MTLAILRGIISSRLFETYNLFVCGRNSKKASSFLKNNGLNDIVQVSLIDNHQVLVKDKTVFLCIKPDGLQNFKFIGRAKNVISVMAGVQVSIIKKHLDSMGYVRVMPNVAAKYQKSSSAIFIDNANLDEIKRLVLSFGNFVQVDKEALIDSAIATSGSAPAFVALMAQALIDAGVREGFNRLQSQELVRGMFEGFSLLLREKTPQEIIDEIASPGGTTIEGISTLEKHAFKGIVMEATNQAVLKARKKS